MRGIRTIQRYIRDAAKSVIRNFSFLRIIGRKKKKGPGVFEVMAALKG